MRLTWHDGVATLLTAGAVAMYAGFRTGADMPLVSSARWTAVAVLVGATVALWVAATARHLVTRPQTRVTAG